MKQRQDRSSQDSRTHSQASQNSPERGRGGSNANSMIPPGHDDTLQSAVDDSQKVVKIDETQQGVNASTTLQRILAVGFNVGEKQEVYNQFSQKKALEFLESIDGQQLSHAGLKGLKKKEREERVKAAVNEKGPLISFQQVRKDMVNPKTGNKESYWWEVNIDGSKNYFLYSYEGWKVIFDYIFGSGIKKDEKKELSYKNNPDAKYYKDLTDKLSGKEINKFKEQLYATYYSQGKSKAHVKHGSSSDSTYSVRSQLADFLSSIESSDRHEVAVAIYQDYGVYL